MRRQDKKTKNKFAPYETYPHVIQLKHSIQILKQLYKKMH